MKTFKIYTLGCKVNWYDSSDLKNKLQRVGFKLVEDEQTADLVIINTCSVTKNAHRKDKRIIKLAKRDNPKAKVVVMGCWYKIYPEIVDKIKADLFWPVGQLDGLTDNIAELFQQNGEEFGNKFVRGNSRNIQEKFKIAPPGNGERSRYFMKVQDGCEQFCSYCVIPYSRGKLKSRDWEDVVREAQVVEESGYEEIILCGIHLGLYNQENGSSLLDKNLTWLIKKIIARTRRVRIRISSIEVNDISDELIKLLKIENRFCNHLHIPLQGGEDELLRLMNRPYDTKYFADKIKKIRKAVPSVAITADVIVGFPSETEKQFKNTYDFIKKVGLNKLHVFPYSKHDRTAAAKMPKHLDKKIKQKRSRILRELSELLWKSYQKKIISEKSDFNIVVKRVDDEVVTGKTEYYFDVVILRTKIKVQDLRIGKIIKVSVSDFL